jgi:protein O-mannosyl-transferase
MSAPTNNGPAFHVQRWRVPAVCLVLAAITFAVFGQTLTHEFVDFDDDDYVYENPVVARGLTLKGIVWAFTQAHAANWHPLTWLSHMLDCQLYGLHPGGHHLTNVLLHTATVIALFLVLRQMTGTLWRSAFVAAVFAIHPLRVESVAWVAERKDVLSGLFFMLTIGTYVRYARHPWSLARYGLVMLLFAMGLMCKPMLVTLPVVLLLLDYWPLQRTESAEKLVLEKLPLLALSAASCVATLLAQNKAIQSGGSFSLLFRLGNALVACVVYLRQMIWPVGLAAHYPYHHNGLPPWEVALAGTLVAGLSAAAVWQWRKQPWLLVGWLWYLAMLLPVAGIIQVGIQAHADRYTYLPQIGIYMAVTWLAAQWRASRVTFGGLMGGVLAVLMFCAWQQTAYWKNSETLWTHALACAADDELALCNLGTALFEKGRADEAIVRYQQALQINPNYTEPQFSLANALLQKGKVDEAIYHFMYALHINPDYAQAHDGLGGALLRKGRVEEAASHFQKALQINPDDAQAYYNLGTILLKKGRTDEAIAHYQLALQINPDYAQAHYNLGNILLEKGRVEEAISHYQLALQNNPGCTEALVNLGSIMLQKGRMDEAIAHYQLALQIDPDCTPAHVNLGGILLQRGKVDEAIVHFQKALQIKPNDANMHHTLGNAFLQKGRAQEAIAQYRQALQLKPDYVEAQNNLAWLLATGPEASLRDGHKAVELARQANTLTGGENPIILRTLAAALAEAGRFSEAAETAQRALHLAGAQANTRLAGQLQSEMKLYQAGSPFHIPEQTH